MCTAFTHAFVAAAGGLAVFGPRMPARFWVLSIACSAGPDLDVALHSFGVEYADPWGHRGMTHSLFFAAVLSVLVVSAAFRWDAPWLGRRWWALVAYFFVLTASHGFLDAFTDGGLGIAFFAPFTDARYFLPVRNVEVAPLAISAFFTQRGIEIMKSEMLWIWLPWLGVAGATWCVMRARDRMETT